MVIEKVGGRGKKEVRNHKSKQVFPLFTERRLLGSNINNL